MAQTGVNSNVIIVEESLFSLYTKVKKYIFKIKTLPVKTWNLPHIFYKVIKISQMSIRTKYIIQQC